MLHADLHGKLGSAARETERLEDILTSNVFGVLFTAEAWQVIASWLSCAIPIGHSIPLVHGAFEPIEYWFWPRLRDAEPDVVLRIGDLFAIIEAKFHSGKTGSVAVGDGTGSDVDQLVREWRACEPHDGNAAYPEGLRTAIVCCRRVLVYLVQRSKLARERRAIETSAQQAPGARMYLLTWEDLDEALAEPLSEQPRWAAELRAYLRLRRLTAFRGFRGALPTCTRWTNLASWSFSARPARDLARAFSPSALPRLRSLAARWEPTAPSWPRVLSLSSISTLRSLAAHRNYAKETR